jgi:hypothetical protein
MLSMISTSVTPFFRWSSATTWAVLLPPRIPLRFSSLAGAFSALGAFLAGVAFLFALPLRALGGRALGGPCASLGLLVDLRLRWFGGFAKALYALPDLLALALAVCLLPVAGEPSVITLDFVDTNGTVVDHKDFTVAALPPIEPSSRARRWRGRTLKPLARL